jgi:pimeloyl-ACP methyl ester carboxylesterase
VRKLVPAFLSMLLAGCLAAGPRPEIYRAASPLSRPPLGVVFVANGAGDVRALTQNLTHVMVEACVPLQIETVPWSHGQGRYIADQVDHANHRSQGSRLAVQVATYRQTCPDRRIYLIGHSAGCAVLLAAAESLPPGSVDRIILLSPSVCQSYDLRPALSTARSGIDVFYSSQDRLMLGLGVKILGTAERACRTAAGKEGFTPVIACPPDAALYSKLRQHPWDHSVEWSGHGGGHFGNTRSGFLRAYVLPLYACN